MNTSPATPPPPTAPPTVNRPLTLQSMLDGLDVGVVRSRIGRRMLSVMVLCATLPVVIAAVLSYSRASSELHHERDAERAQIARGYGLAVIDRLRWIDGLIAVVVTEARPDAPVHRALAPRIGRELQAVALVDRQGRSHGALGEAFVAPTLSEFQVAELARGETVLTVTADTTATAPRVGLLRRVPSAGIELRHLYVEVAPAFLWGERGANAPQTELCVVAGAGAALHCTAAVPADVLAAFAQSPNGAAPRSWDARAGAYRSNAWRLPLHDAFASDDWTIVASQPAALGLGPARSIGTLLTSIAVLALLTALAAGAVLFGRVVTPIDRLLRATRRIEQGDFAIALDGDRFDELGELGVAFNRMAGRLDLQFGTMKALSQIDRAIMKSLDLGDVAKNSLRSVRRITAADIVSVGLLEPEHADTMGVYIVRGDESTRAARGYMNCPPDVAQQLTDLPDGDWSEVGDLPREYLALLKPGNRRACWVQAIRRDDRFRGVIVLAHDQPRPLSEDRRALLRGVADRLAVALAGAERERRLHMMAHEDNLTGLPNRHSLLGLLEKELARARREQQRIGVLFLDLDRFKQTNDTLGHAAGDLLLKQAARRIKENLREADTVGRHGGDEFTVLLGNLGAARDAGHVARELIKALSKPFDIDGHTVYVGASVGIALYPEDGSDGADLLKKADTAMYRAKEHGRNRFAYYEEKMNAEVTRRATLDRELRQGFERGEFVLHYQPQIDLRSGLVCAAEALIRWQHPERGLLYPNAFIAFAEECGLIDAIGSWVLREACLQHGRWRAAGVPIPRVAVNISNRQLRRSKFVQAVDFTMVATKMPPDCLEIEVTESLFLDGGKAAIDALKALEAAGAHVAIDDFGTGYSSFGYLKTLPASIIKLDRSFITDVATDRDSAAIAAAIVKMAHMLRKEVVAEGVETFGQLDYLRQLDCEKVQGYLFSRPLRPDDAAEFAHQRVLVASGNGAGVPAAIDDRLPAAERTD
jgi:diguanylate cyclase (GGDEF)-like protein